MTEIEKKNRSFYLVIAKDGNEYTLAISRNCDDVLEALESEASRKGIESIYAYRRVC